MRMTGIRDRIFSAYFLLRALTWVLSAAALAGGWVFVQEAARQRLEYERCSGGAGLSSEPGPDTLKKMAFIPAGEFRMGSREEEGQSEEHPLHKVYLDAFYIGRREITVRQYKAFADATGRKMREQGAWSTDAHPVVNVSWYEAWAYCRWSGGRLPTEAEWEKAARGGSDGDYSLDDRERLDKFSWDSANSGDIPHPAGLKAANRFGLYDMRGNVWEWTADWLDYGYYRKSPAQNPKGPDAGAYRVLRGGSVHYDGSYLRMAYRGSNYPSFRSRDIGFRCAASAGPVGR